MSPEAHQRLSALFNSGQNPFFMTAQEGEELAKAGLITVDPNQVNPANPQAFLVQITETGVAALSQPAAPAAPPAVAPPVAPTAPESPKFQVSTGVAIPKVKRGGGANNLTPRKSQYPFDELPEPTVGQDGQPAYASFHVPVTQENPEPWKRMASNVSAANKRCQVEVKDDAGQTVMELVTKKTLIKGEDNKPLLDGEGKKQYREEQVSQPKMQSEKKFIARRVNGDDPNGEGVRVFRVPLNF